MRVLVSALDDSFVDGGDTRVFAPRPHTLSGIQGPLNIDGGGGAGSVGFSPSGATYIGGMGGAGLASSISGAQVFYAGGGGGGTGSGVNNGGLGGGGGGGNGGGAPSPPATSGLANTGGGGGGWGYLAAGAAGGSGIVILRYPSYQAAAKTTTGSPQTYVAGPWRIYVFIASGTITF